MMFNINEIDIHELKGMLGEAKRPVKLIDVRSPAEIAQGTIPGAHPLPLHLLPLQLDQVPDDEHVVFFCRTGARSAQACAFAGQQGKTNVSNLRGGIIAWVQDGMAVS